jgi:hypothetical protein
VKACPDRRETNVRSSNRTNELAQTETAARRCCRAVEQSSYSCAFVGIVSRSDPGVAGAKQEVQDAQDYRDAEWFDQQQLDRGVDDRHGSPATTVARHRLQEPLRDAVARRYVRSYEVPLGRVWYPFMGATSFPVRAYRHLATSRGAFPKHQVTRRRGLIDVPMCVWQGQNSMSMSTGSSVIVYNFVGKQPTQYIDQNVVYITPMDTSCYMEVPCHNVLNVRASDIQGHIITLLFFADTLRNREPSREGDDINTGIANYGMFVCSCPVHQPEVMQTHIESIMTKTTSILSYDLRSKSTHVPMRRCNILHIHDAKKLNAKDSRILF